MLSRPIGQSFRFFPATVFAQQFARITGWQSGQAIDFEAAQCESFRALPTGLDQPSITGDRLGDAHVVKALTAALRKRW